VIPGFGALLVDLKTLVRDFGSKNARDTAVEFEW
jgi:hypothetical protein